MIPINNPFIRGYQNLAIQRLLAIRYEEDCPLTYLPLHSSQAHLADDQVHRFPCVFCDDFALVTEGQDVSSELDDHCTGMGVVQTVVYAITADEYGVPLHVGDTYSHETALEVVRRLAFDTGHYSRCWEISTGHLPSHAQAHLEYLADVATPTGLLFEAFRIPSSNAVGVKLIATPWTDTNLRFFDGSSTATLHQTQREAGVPQPLVDVMHLAALADVRIVIFDPDALVLEGLPTFDD
ncbi:MAG: ABC transporter substrate-binding protein [Porticoccus sp.]|uniref:DUF5983 family protein n=1 Tax=Porticoccus hydrocarbonoclasticus TaxID=1073414 RepID=UPI000C53F2AE|nr:ABC transporter substrate-binding protein [Porticoccus hydrocarbonoclasticus]MBG58765.1 ABC transporter substrate-binding protein [Porticoccus sp.]|tara:strand:- start:1537 stop:2250 length:714 start_codon:yes stop_codon:yes gene_type:complete